MRVLLDLGMPRMDGFARRLRAEPSFQGATIVALTGWGQPADRARTAAAGFDYHLTKRADQDTLVRLLQSPRGGAVLPS